MPRDGPLHASDLADIDAQPHDFHEVNRRSLTNLFHRLRNSSGYHGDQREGERQKPGDSRAGNAEPAEPDDSPADCYEEDQDNPSGGVEQASAGRLTQSSAFSLLDRDRLRQVPWLVDVAAAEFGYVVGEELQGHCDDDGRE